MRHSHSAGGVVIGPGGKVLAVNTNNDSWSLPKGHIDPGETAQQAAEREILEESGINQIKFVKELGSYDRYKIGKGGHGEDKSDLKTITMFLYSTDQTELEPTDPHHPDAVWVDKEKVADLLTHPKDKAFFDNILPELK